MKTHEIIYHLFGDSVVLHLNGSTHTISKTDRRFKAIHKMIAENSLEKETLVLLIDASSKYFKVTQRILKSIGLA